MKLDPRAIRYLTSEDWRVLTGVSLEKYRLSHERFRTTDMVIRSRWVARTMR